MGIEACLAMAEKMAQIRPYPGMRVAQDKFLLSTYFRLPLPRPRERRSK